ncbi:sigma factor [Micromonospora sp. WMMD812]|uniref:sigma factor n=1 Tax=Micromonospora sp. WMMD812 TaxID=3015152 RepID=UPI00248D22CE|nr:sigma factor [Micromonospora sp. WMMD812]WBB68368.1 sigma factor [Micromonospora sp. WMMD812]
MSDELPPLGPPANTGNPVVFERLLLRTIALHLLGCAADAEDAVRRTYVRWYTVNGDHPARIDNHLGWLVRTVARTCLDALGVRPDGLGAEPIGGGALDRTGSHLDGHVDPVGLALLTVFESMTAAEWVDLVLQSRRTTPSPSYRCVLGGPETTCGGPARCRRRPGPGTALTGAPPP